VYPIYIYEDNVELPEEGEYYVVAGNGTFFHKESTAFRGYVPVPSIAFLEDLDENDCTCLLPKIPHEVVMKVKKFFVQVLKKHGSEACVILYHNKETDQYKVVVPRQWNGYGSVHYIRPSINPDEGLAVGTIHSHCDFNAFHSSTDQEDESTFDGLHITFGNITRPEGMSVVASLVVNDMRCFVDPLLHLDGISHCGEKFYKITPPVSEVDYDAWTAEIDSWLSQVNVGNPPDPWTEEGILAWKEQNGY
jgi:hypothetical protein